MTVVDGAGHSAAAGEKGLKSNALGLVSSIVIGVASTAPGYSLAASLGLVVAAVGIASPAIMWISFVPMLLIAAAYYYLNKADPDCGTTFSWATRAFGPVVGWLGGWADLIADVIVMANLADIAGRYSFLLVRLGLRRRQHVLPCSSSGSCGSSLMTWICYRGIEVSAQTQWFLLAAEILALFLFAVVALVKVYTSPAEGSIRPSLELAQPDDHPGLQLESVELFSLSPVVERPRGRSARRGLHLLGLGQPVAVNEETENKRAHPGRRGDREHGHPRRDLRRRVDRSAGFPGHEVPRGQRRRRPQRAREGRPRLRLDFSSSSRC